MVHVAVWEGNPLKCAPLKKATSESGRSSGSHHVEVFSCVSTNYLAGKKLFGGKKGFCPLWPGNTQPGYIEKKHKSVRDLLVNNQGWKKGKLSPYPHLSFRAVQSPRISANFFVTSVCPFSVFFLPHFFVLMIFFVSPASLCFLLPHARLLAFSLPRRLDLAVFLPRRTSVSLPPWNLLQSRVLDGLVPF